MHILLADDHHLVRESLKAYMEKLSPDTKVLEADTFDSAIKIAHQSEKLDLILLDLVMPGMNGFDGVDIFRDTFPDIPLALLSGTPIEEEAKERLYEQNISYIPKTLNGEELLVVLKESAAGKIYTPQSTGGEVRAFPNFTQKESIVVKYLAQGMKNSEIARHMKITETTVKIHVSRILKKLHVSNRVQAAQKVNQLGWQAVQPSENSKKTANNGEAEK